MNPSRFSARLPLLGVVSVLALGLAACSGGSKPKPRVFSMNDAQCMGFADSLKTLRKGDPLPRVVQVLGQPTGSYRVVAPFGGMYDVVEYQVGEGPCARLVLNARKQKMQVVFDAYGGYVGAGKDVFIVLQRATAVRLSGLPVDVHAYGN